MNYVMSVLLPVVGFLAMVAAAGCSQEPSPNYIVPFSYKPTVPHAQHISMMATDFRHAQDPTENDWTAGHYDHMMSGDIAEFKKRDANIKWYPYVLNLTVIQPGRRPSGAYNEMVEWFKAHPQYNFESAFLHDAAKVKDNCGPCLNCRVEAGIWRSKRWVINPGDEGLRAFYHDRVKRIMNPPGAKYRPDGLFFDEHGSRPDWEKLNLIEYPQWKDYEDDVVVMLALERKALEPGQFIQLNTWFDISDWDARMSIAAGGSHMENVSDPFSPLMPARWDYIEKLLSNGTFVQMVNAWSFKFKFVPDSKEAEGRKKFAGFPPGNEKSTLMRVKMFELACYYMVVPTPAHQLTLYMANNDWDEPFSTRWVKAIEVDVGSPLSRRTVLAKGRDWAWQPYQIFSRDMQRALVLIRPSAGKQYKKYDDSSAVSVRLPSGEKWVPLYSDGTIGPAVRQVKLRQGEAMILLKGSKLEQAPDTAGPARGMPDTGRP